MAYAIRFSADLTSQKIRSIFLGAKFDRYALCEKCHSDRVYKTKPEQYRCRNCWSFFSLRARTFLQRKRIPLRLWYEIAYGFAIGLSAHKLQRVLKVKHYKTIYGGYKTIRQALIQYSHYSFEQFIGSVEVDESYYGGAFKNLRKKTRGRLRDLGLAKRGRGAKYRKQPVFGIYKRNGKVYLELIPDAQKTSLEKIIKKRIRKAGKVFSDTHTGYQGLVGLGYVHRTVNHGNEEYVNGKIHINGIEGFWGLSKTKMHTYKGIRKRNWQEYLKEMEFRYNYRHLDPEEMTVKIIKILCQKEVKFV